MAAAGQNEKNDASARELVDTLFGPGEEVSAHEKVSAAAERELPDFLFGGADGQADLPLADASYYEPNVIEEPNLKFLAPYTDELSLFEKRWGYEKGGETRDEWCRRMEIEAVPILNELMQACAQEELMHPQALYSYVHCAADGEKLLLLPKKGEEQPPELPFPRLANGRSLCDRFKPADANGTCDVVGLIAVNLGKTVSDTLKVWIKEGRTEEARLLSGYAAELLRALAEYAAGIMMKEGVCVGPLHYFGMPKECDPKIQSAILKIMPSERIGISFSRSYLMLPEYTALAMLLPR